MLSESFYRNTLAWEHMREQHGINIRTFPDDVLQAFRKSNEKLLLQVADRSPLAREVIESQQTFLTKAKKWSEITDQNYLRLR